MISKIKVSLSHGASHWVTCCGPVFYIVYNPDWYWKYINIKKTGPQQVTQCEAPCDNQQCYNTNYDFSG